MARQLSKEQGRRELKELRLEKARLSWSGSVLEVECQRRERGGETAEGNFKLIAPL